MSTTTGDPPYPYTFTWPIDTTGVGAQPGTFVFRSSWECHRCKRVNAPHVDYCSCSGITSRAWTFELAKAECTKCDKSISECGCWPAAEGHPIQCCKRHQEESNRIDGAAGVDAHGGSDF